MRALITGTDGFCAKYLLSKLLENDEVEQVWTTSRHNGLSLSYLPNPQPKHINVYCPLQTEPWVIELFKHIQPDIILHIAAEQNNRPTSFLNNVHSAYFLLKYCPKGVRFVLTSSSTVYGDLSTKKVCDENDPTNSTTLYSASKISSESLLNSYHNTGKINGLILRPCAITGVGNNKGIVYELCRKIQDENKVHLELFGEEPGSIKPFIHVDDVISAIIHLTFGQFTGIFNLSSSDNISVDKIAEIVMKNYCYKPKLWLGAESTFTGDNPVVKMSNQKLLDSGFVFKYNSSEEAVRAAVKEIIGEQGKSHYHVQDGDLF